jgi:tRNA (cmo5U34)-methyltransferase
MVTNSTSIRPATWRRSVSAYEELQDAVADATAGVHAERLLAQGVATGETSRRLLHLSPAAELVGVDQSADMLAAASIDVAAADLRVSRLQDLLPEGNFDLVVSALAVHHHDDAAKADLFARAAARLRPGGRFVLGHLVVPDDPADVVTPIDVHDQPSTVDDQLRWLAAAGFQAEVVWPRHDLCVIVADLPS